MRIASLYSGSSGNCTLVETKKYNLLIDVGVSMKKINEGLLMASGIDLDDVNYIIITHAHADHILSFNAIYNKYPHILFITHESVHQRLLEALKREYDSKRFVFVNDELEGEHLYISNFELSHDTPSFGWNIDDYEESLCFVADGADHSYSLIDKHKVFEKPFTYYMIECDYDETMLYLSRNRKVETKRRTLGKHGHTSNVGAIKKLVDFIQESENTKCKGVIFHHLSDETNNEIHAREVHLGYLETWGLLETIGTIPIKYARKDEIVHLE